MRARPGVVTASLVIDVLCGEPPTAAHPTVWMGHAIAALRRHAPQRPLNAFAAGAGLVAVGGVATAALALWLTHVIRRAPFSALVEGFALKPALSLRALLDAAADVERALADHRLEEARRRLARDLVSRPTHELSASEVAGATISSLAENLSDSVVAPIAAYCVAGLPAAYAYRFVNTADAMIGYHSRQLEWFGKAAARTDDLLNLGPARVTALLILVAAALSGCAARDGWRVARTDSGNTSSPNGGWPMSAMAGVLGVRLEKRGAYVLNAPGRPASVSDIAQARRIVTIAAGLSCILAELACTVA